MSEDEQTGGTDFTLKELEYRSELKNQARNSRPRSAWRQQRGGRKKEETEFDTIDKAKTQPTNSGGFDCLDDCFQTDSAKNHQHVRRTELLQTHTSSAARQHGSSHTA